MKTHIIDPTLRQRLDIIELLALLNIELETATEIQLLNAKLFIQKLQLAGIGFNDIKQVLFNIVERMPSYKDLDLEAVMLLRLPITELDTAD